jgi:thymidine kinase
MWQSRILTEVSHKKQRRSLHIDKGTIDQEDRKCKHVCTEHQKIQFHKVNTTGHKGTDRPNTVVEQDFNIPLSATERSFRQNINQETPELNNTIDEVDLTYICRIFCSTTSEFTLFLASHRTF